MRAFGEEALPIAIMITVLTGQLAGLVARPDRTGCRSRRPRPLRSDRRNRRMAATAKNLANPPPRILLKADAVPNDVVPNRIAAVVFMLVALESSLRSKMLVPEQNDSPPARQVRSPQFGVMFMAIPGDWIENALESGTNRVAEFQVVEANLNG